MIGLSLGMPDERVVPANDVAAKIKAGELSEYNNFATVDGLDLLDFSQNKKAIASPIRITNSFEDYVGSRKGNFEYGILKKTNLSYGLNVVDFTIFPQQNRLLFYYETMPQTYVDFVIIPPQDKSSTPTTNYAPISFLMLLIGLLGAGLMGVGSMDLGSTGSTPYGNIPTQPQLMNVYYVSKSNESGIANLQLYTPDPYYSRTVFSWDEIPGEGNERLIKFLTQNYSTDFEKSANIEKIENNQIIQASTEKKSLFSKTLSYQVILIDDGKIIIKHHTLFELIENIGHLAEGLADEFEKKNEREKLFRYVQPVGVYCPGPIPKCCAVCGADLIEKNRLLEYGKYYCLPCYVRLFSGTTGVVGTLKVSGWSSISIIKSLED
jgi:hypothetical protein